MTATPAEDRFDSAWRAHRAYLVDLAFRMLGDVGNAEDVVQEAFSRLARTDAGEVDDDRGWLTVVTSRLCLDQLRSARSRRERAQDTAVIDTAAPIAQHPMIDPADRVTLDDEVRLALFVVLQRLGPAERVAFVLHDVFQTPFEAIGQTLGRSPATCRQLARRARQRIAGDPLRAQQVERSEHRLVTDKFITACANGDLDGLLAVLHPQAWGTAEFGTGSPIRTQVKHGAELVAENLIRYYGHGATLVSRGAAGEVALLAFFDRKLFALITLTVRHERITKLYVAADPDAIAALTEPRA